MLHKQTRGAHRLQRRPYVESGSVSLPQGRIPLRLSRGLLVNSFCGFELIEFMIWFSLTLDKGAENLAETAKT